MKPNFRFDYFDDDWNEVDPEVATRIIRLEFDDTGRVKDRLELVPKKKVSKVDEDDILEQGQSLIEDIVKLNQSQVQQCMKIIRICWEQIDSTSDVMRRQEIFRTILRSIEIIHGAERSTSSHMLAKKYSSRF